MVTLSTPYEVVYNQPFFPVHLFYLPGESSNIEVDRILHKREQMITKVKQHLQKAQNRMKVQADQHKTVSK